MAMRTYKYHHNYGLKFVHEELICLEIGKKLMDEYRLHLLERGLNAVNVNSYISNISPVVSME